MVLKKLKTATQKVKIRTGVYALANNDPEEVKRMVLKFFNLRTDEAIQIMEHAKLYKNSYSFNGFPSVIFKRYLNKTMGEYENKISLHFSKEFMKAMSLLTEEKYFYSTVEVAICVIHYQESNQLSIPEKPYIEKPLLKVMGNKELWGCNYIEKVISKIPEHITHCYDVFGGSGFLTVLAVQSGRFQKVYYNDADREKINFFKVIKKSSVDFKSALLTMISLKNPKINNAFSQAVAYWLKSRCVDKKNDISKIKLEDAIKKFRENLWHNLAELDVLEAYHNAFQHITILENESDGEFNDALKLLEKIENKKNIFAIIDSPYGAVDYKAFTGRAFEDKEHEKLAKLIYKLKGLWEYHNRATAPGAQYRKIDETTNMNYITLGELDKSFGDKGYFAFAYPYRSESVVEVVISKYKFDGFEAYEDVEPLNKPLHRS